MKKMLSRPDRVTFEDEDGLPVSMPSPAARKYMASMEDKAKQKIEAEYLHPIVPRDSAILQARAEWLQEQLSMGRTYVELRREMMRRRRGVDPLTQPTGDGRIQFYDPRGQKHTLPEEQFKAMLPKMDAEAKQLLETEWLGYVAKNQPEALEAERNRRMHELPLLGLSFFEIWMPAVKSKLRKTRSTATP